MGKYCEKARKILEQLTLREKVAQLSQTVAGYRCFTRNGDDFILDDELKKFVKDYGAFGALSNILRADGFTKHNWGQGIEPNQRVRVANQIQKYVLENSRIPIPVLIEVEANHGVHALGSEMFPTNLAMGCMFNHELYGKIMKTVSKEIKLSGNHIGFVTMLDMARDPRWGRTEEFFSEDPYLAAKYTESGVKAFKSESALICCKHYCATGDGEGGLNAAEVNIGKRELHDIYLPSVEKAVKSGADIFMAAYNSVDGVPCHINSYLLKDVLRDELGFDGIVLSDGFAVQRNINQLGLDEAEGAVLSIRSGVDISLADQGAFLKLIDACENGIIEESYIDRAVMRVLEKKFEIGLFDCPYLEENGALEKYLASGEQKRLSYQASAESAVLLKNNGILPLKPETKVALFGLHASNVYYQLGSYTAFRSPEEMRSIKEVFTDGFGNCKYTKGWDFRGSDEDFENALKICDECDVAIVTIGGNSSGMTGETVYDRLNGGVIGSRNFMDCGEGLDVADLKLPGNQIEFIERLKETGKPVIAVLVGGRPYILNKINEISDALLAAFYSGQQGADALFDILTGKVNPSGKLSVSIPTSAGCLPVYYNRIGVSVDGKRDSDHSMNYCDTGKRVLFPFGYGLSYSEFRYDDIKVEKLKKNKYRIWVTVTNVSDIKGREVVQLYIRGSGNTIRRRGLELKGYKKIELNPNETKQVDFILGFNELKIYTQKNIYEIEPAKVAVFAGSNPNLPLCAEIYTEYQIN
ncbi:MAG: glycoside hydrolase family 3 C-terminal domain-containing protein [Clostridia bacterium]|nr:glycoside hydrolase family 3 C-terminal domain-containing protein [Clostridia bacterium]